MNATRIPCKKCRTKILTATAEANDGLCGQCARKAEEATDRKRRAQKKREEAARPIEYDIDAILGSEDFMTTLDGALPESDDPRYSRLTPIERDLQSLAEFDRRCGSGFEALVTNRHFELLSRARKAAKKMRRSILLAGLSDLEHTLRRHRFPRWIRRRDGFYASLSESGQAALDRDVEALDSKYFTYEADSIWSTPDFREGTQEYAQKHADALRKRRP